MEHSIFRDTAREATWLQCLVRVDPETIVRGLITNVSDSGAELRCKHQLHIGQSIEVATHNGSPRKRASITRVDGNCYGVQWRLATHTFSAV